MKTEKVIFQDGGVGHLGFLVVKMTHDDIFKAKNGFLVVELLRKVHWNVIIG